MAALGTPDLPTVLSAGFADGPVSDPQLMRSGLSGPPDRRSPALVGYIWAINLAEGDRFSLRIDREGQMFSEQLTEPLDRSKAVYVAYSGKRGSPPAGHYRLEAGIVRQGKTIVAERREFTLK